MRKWTVLIGWFFVYSTFNAEGLPVQIDAKIGDEHGLFERETDCKRVQSYLKHYTETLFENRPGWRADFSRPCEPYKPQGRMPR